MDAIEYNRKLDAELAKNGAVDEALFLNLLDAYSYDGATPVSWVSGKIHILRSRILGGHALSLFEVERRVKVEITTLPAFDAWVLANFPGIEG